MTAATWILVGVILGGSVGFVAGCILGIIAAGRGPCEHCRQWQTLVDEQDDELRGKDAELANADQAIEDAHRDRDLAWQAGIVQGQLLQADREAEGL
jgi:hypothetical protein